MQLRSFSQKPLVLSFLLNVAFLVLCLGIGGLHYGCIDDYFMASVVSGAYGGNFDAHTLFVNGAYAYFLRPFYAVFPKIGWYSIFELVGVFVAFTSATYSLLRNQCGKLNVSVVVFLLACVSPAFYLQLGFTQCAAAMTAAGILQIYTGHNEKKIPSLLFGAFLLICGMIFRREGFLLGVPFLFLLLAVSSFEKKSVYKWTIAVLLACAGAYQGLQSFNKSLFNNEDFSYYLAYQGPRAMLGDGAYYDSKNVYDELEERGKSGRDFDLLQQWVFYDTEVFSLDSLKPIVNVINRNRYDLNYAKLPVQLFFVVANSFWGINAWCWGLICVFLFVGCARRANMFTWGSLALIALCLSYLLLMNRVVGHVENSIWLYAIFSAIPFIKSTDFNKKKFEKLPSLISIVGLSCFVLAYMSLPKIENNRALFGLPQKSESLQKIIDIVNSNPDNVYLFPITSYMEYALFYGNILEAVAPKSLGNIIPIGYWNINHPGMIQEMYSRGVQNPLRDIVKENVFVVDEEYKLPLQNFYRRHYGDSIAVDTVAKFGYKSLLKYKKTDLNAEVGNE